VEYAAAGAVAVVKESAPTMIDPLFNLLEPWVAEENKGITQINIPMDAKQLIISLKLPSYENIDQFNAELYASNGSRGWNNDNLSAQDGMINITFNATFFLSDN